jgi:hypothetical protein
MPAMRWARLQVDLNLALRRGAWYRVQEVRSLEVLVDVNHRSLLVPAAFLQVVQTPPRKWTVVPRPANAVRLPEDWKQYAVCPSCGERAPLERRPPVMQCGRCRGTFEVAWKDPYRPKL